VTNQLQQEIVEFQNENISVKLTKNPGCKVHLEVAVQPVAVRAAYEKAFRNVKKEVSIPGFRKGKVPDEIVKKNYAPQIDREWRDTCIQTAFSEAVLLIKLPPLSERSIKRSQLKKCSLEEGAEAHFDYESEPSVPEIDVATIESRPIAPKPVNEEEVDAHIKKFLVGQATFTEVTDRAVQTGDYVELDLDVIENPAHNVFTSRLFHVTKDEMPEWVYALVPGMQVNESREGKVVPHTIDHVHTAECHHEHEEPKLCRIMVTAIKQGTVPEESDEIAQKFGGSSMADLREKVRSMFVRNAQFEAQEMARSALANELLLKYPIDLPEQLLNGEVNARFSFVKAAVNRQNGGAVPMTQAAEQELRANVRAIAAAFLNIMYLMNPIARRENFPIRQDELQEEVTTETMFTMPDQRIVFPNMDPNEARHRLMMRILMRKSLDYLLGAVQQDK